LPTSRDRESTVMERVLVLLSLGLAAAHPHNLECADDAI
jgi:hypothetical protein